MCCFGSFVCWFGCIRVYCKPSRVHLFIVSSSGIVRGDKKNVGTFLVCPFSTVPFFCFYHSCISEILVVFLINASINYGNCSKWCKLCLKKLIFLLSWEASHCWYIRVIVVNAYSARTVASLRDGFSWWRVVLWNVIDATHCAGNYELFQNRVLLKRGPLPHWSACGPRVDWRRGSVVRKLVFG